MKFSAAIAALFMASEAAAFVPAASRAAVPSVRYSSVAEPEEKAKVPAGLEKELNSLEKEIEGMRAVQDEKMDQAKEVSTSFDKKAEEAVQAFVPPPSAPSISDWDRIEPGRYNDMEMSIAMPMLKRPSKLDGTHAGDYGFDPLGLSESFDLYTMMEAEVRHARLAMLAVIGWPLSELVAPNWMLQGSNHLAPSVLNGFNPASFIVTAAIFAGLGFAEYKTALRINSVGTELGKKHTKDMQDVWKYGVPGDYNFDPLGLYNSFGDSAVGRKAMRELEISHGRWAMMAITTFAAWEALTGHPVVENTMFFEPNALLPALGVGWFAFNQIYEIKNTDQYFFQIETTSEGEMRLEEINRRMGYLAEESKELGPLVESGIETVKNLKQKYDNFTEDYTESKMSYTKEQ